MPLRTRPESAAWEQPGLAPATQADVPAVIALIGRVFAEYGFVYTRLGFRQVGERTLVGDVNQTREYRFERGV